MRSRTREKGSGLSWEPASPFPFSDSRSRQLRFSHARTDHRNNVPPPTVEPVVVDILGRVITIPPPGFMKGSTNWFLDLSPSYLEDVKNRIVESFYPELLRLYTASTSAVASDDYMRMSDIVGSGFKAGSNYKCNPCDSQKRKMQAGTAEIGESSSPVVNVTSGGVQYDHAIINITASYTVAGLVGVPKGLYNFIRTELLPTRGISSYEYLYSDAYGAIQDSSIDLLTTLAELDKSVLSTVSIMRRLGNLLKAAKKGDFSGLLSKSKIENANTAADLWLEARYAIRPMMYDVEGAIKAMSSDGTLAQIRKAYRHEYEETSHEIDSSFYHEGVHYAITGVVNEVVKARAGCYARLNVDVPFVDNLGLANIASTAWDLLPWSFVFNWFVNTSGLIASLNPNPIYQVMTGFTSLHQEFEYSLLVEATVNDESATIPISGTESFYHRIAEDKPSLISLNVNLSIPKLIDLMGFSRNFK